jgi:hypothetical protein
LYFSARYRRSQREETYLIMVKVNMAHDPNGGDVELKRLCRLDRELADDRRMMELIRLRLAFAEAKRLALLREAEWRSEEIFHLSRSIPGSTRHLIWLP